MAVGTEARLPFLDHRLAEAVLATSAHTKLKNGFTKHSLRRAMADLLPAEVCWEKKKRVFDTPARQWFMTNLAAEMKDLLSRRDSPLSEFVETGALLKHYGEFRNSNGDALTEHDWFKLAGTSLWLDQLKLPSRACEPAFATC